MSYREHVVALVAADHMVFMMMFGGCYLVVFLEQMSSRRGQVDADIMIKRFVAVSMIISRAVIVDTIAKLTMVIVAMVDIAYTRVICKEFALK